MSERSELLDLVGRFSDEMREKLLRKHDRGWNGWQFIDPKLCRARLLEHVERNDWADVANFAAFLWALSLEPPK